MTVSHVLLCNIYIKNKKESITLVIEVKDKPPHPGSQGINSLLVNI